MNRISYFIIALAVSCTPAAREHEQSAKKILKASGVTGGLIVHLGCGEGMLTAALLADDSYIVHGLDIDAVTIAKAREYIHSQDLGGKVSVAVFDGQHLPYAGNLVNLLVSEDSGSVTRDEVIRVLAPLGVAYIKKNGKWSKTVKPWPEDIDEWTHHLHGPDGNPVAQDRVVDSPKKMQWRAYPKWSRAHDSYSSINAMVTADGRIFYMADEAPASISGDNELPDKWVLTARDAFNGILLWKIPIKDWGWRSWKKTWYYGRGGTYPSAFLVSAKLQNGSVTQVEIRAESGGEIVLEDPFKGVEFSCDQAYTKEGENLVFKLGKGESASLK